MFSELKTCFSNRHTSIQPVSAWSSFVGFDLHPPKQRHLAIAHNQTKHLRTSSQSLAANFQRTLHKNQTNADSAICVRGTRSLQLIVQTNVTRSALPHIPIRRTR